MEAEFKQLVQQCEDQENTSKEVRVEYEVSKGGVIIKVVRKLQQEFESTNIEGLKKRKEWMTHKLET